MGSLVSSSANTQDGQKRLVANKPVEVALNEIVTRARVFTDAGGAAIALRDGDYLITRASSGNIAPDVGARNAVEGSLTGQAVLKGVPIHIEDSDKDPRVDAEICRQLNTRSFIVTPIAGSTTMLGVLAVFASTPNAFTRTDLAVLRTMADQIATALGGGTFMQQLWPSENAAEGIEAPAPPVQYEPEPVKQAPEPPKFQARVETPKYEPPRQEPPRREAPKAEPVRQKPAVAETHVASPAEPDTDVLESEPIVMPEKVRPREIAQAKAAAAPAPAVERAKPAPIPRVEPQPPQEEIEPIAQTPEQPKVAAKPITAARPIAVKTPAPTPVAKKEPPRPQVKEQPVTGRAKAKPEEEDVEVGDELDRRAARRERERAAAAAKADAAVESRKEVEWRGFGAEQETESRPMGKIIIGAVAALVVVGIIVGVIMMKKSPSKSAPAASTPAATAPATTAAAPATTTTGTTAASTTAQPSKPATTAPATTAATTTAPAAKPVQPAMVIAPGSAPRQTPVVEDAAPPQLAFGGSAPQLPGTNAALPKRAASDPIPAQVIRRVAPAYPDMARRLRQKGAVELQAEVKKDGTVGKVDVVSGPALLRQAAVDAVKQWRYRPAQLSGTAVDSTVKVIINFDAGQ